MIKRNEFGRRIGESHHKSVLTDHEVDLLFELLIFRDEVLEAMAHATVAQINARLHEEQLSYRQLAIKFEVHPQTIAKIARGERRCQTPHYS